MIGAAVKDITKFYEAFLGTPYQGSLVFLTFASIDRHRPIGKNTLTFAVYPTIAFDGLISFDSFLDKGHKALNEVFWHTLAHELAHYYFGTLLVPAGTYHWFYLESTAEYLSMLALRHFLGDEAYRKRIRSDYERVQKISELVPLDQLNNQHMDSGNWYYYWPLILTALESEIGRDRMANIMKSILTTPRKGALATDFFG